VSTDNQVEVEFNSCEAQEAKIKSFITSQEKWKFLRSILIPVLLKQILIGPPYRLQREFLKICLRVDLPFVALKYFSLLCASSLER
jgi:hypothetical protein